MAGLAVQLRALQERGAAMPICAPPHFAELLARVGMPLVASGMMLSGGWL